MRKKSLGLKLLNEHTLHQAILPGLISYCPSMDLIALGTIDNQVQIFRHNGEEVYKSNQRNKDVKLQSLAWKPNGLCPHFSLFAVSNLTKRTFLGQLLAVAWSDGSVKLIGAESTKVVHQFSAAAGSAISCIGWASNFTAVEDNSFGPTRKPQTWNELLALHGDDGESGSGLDLPRDLSQIDIETSLPKLSVLASGGTS